MARRIVRRKKVSHTARSRKIEPVRPDTALPEAKPLTSTRVLIAAPGPMRTVLTSKISGSTEVMLAGVADNEMSAVEKTVTEDADVAAVYIHLGGELVGLDIARDIVKASPQVGILIMVNDLAGVDVRRHARMFGVAWSYAIAENVQSGTRFTDLVQSVGRGIHWIDPELKRVLEAIWQVADQGKDLEASATAKKKSDTASSSTDTRGSSTAPDTTSMPRGIQTMQAGRGGVGTGGFGVSSSDDEPFEEEDEEDEELEDKYLPDAPAPKPGGIQTTSTGKGGIGHDGFGVSKTG